MKKKDRHQMLTELLNDHDIQKQEEFVELLQEKKGIAVTQATISRDIKEMKLIKVPAANGGYRYSLPTTTLENTEEKLKNLMKDALLAVEQMEKFVIVHTLPGTAPASANLLDRYYKSVLFAALNDDDNVLMITRTENDAQEIEKQLSSYLDN